jgi:DNA replication licensing factor MCM2
MLSDAARDFIGRVMLPQRFKLDTETDLID